jgi:hypothetical protein
LLAIISTKAKRSTFAVLIALAINIGTPLICRHLFLNYGTTLSSAGSIKFDDATYYLAYVKYSTSNWVGWIGYDVYKCDGLGIDCAIHDRNIGMSGQVTGWHFATDANSKRLFVESGLQKIEIDSVD